MRNCGRRYRCQYVKMYVSAWNGLHTCQARLACTRRAVYVRLDGIGVRDELCACD